MPHDVFVISSGDSDDSLPSVMPAVPGPEKRVNPRCHTMSSDEDEILPLFERVARKTGKPCFQSEFPPKLPTGFNVVHGSDEPAAPTVPKPKLEPTRRDKLLDLSSSSEEDLPDLNDCPLDQKHSVSFSESDGGEEVVVEAPKTKPKIKSAPKSRKIDADVLAKREEVRRQREEKAALLQREKALKQVQTQQLRSMKPGECIKFVKAIMDLSLLEMPEAVDIPRVLTDAGVQYALKEQAAPRSITWVRQVDHSAVDCNNKIDRVILEEEESQALVVLPVTEFLAAVHQFKQEQIGEGSGCTLHDVVCQLKALLYGKAVTVMICGIQKYFQQQRSKQQREYRTKVLDDAAGETRGKPKRARKHKESDVDVSRVDVEEALVDLQIREPCNFRLVDTAAEVAQIAASFTKAIAEAPYKQSKEDGGTFSWLACGDTGQTVKVDKDGAGLLLLWQRQIEQFHMVSTDVAQAIVAEYSSPTALMKAYSRCAGPKECEKLLQDIVVRRGVGPLATTKRIGPELSRKLYVLFTSTDGSQVLNAC